MQRWGSAGCADDTPSPEWSESCPEPAGRVPHPLLCSLQLEPPETFMLPPPPDTLAMGLPVGTGRWRLCEAVPRHCPLAFCAHVAHRPREQQCPLPAPPRDSCFGSREAQGACLHGGRGVSGSWAGPADPCPLGLPFFPFPDSSPCPLPPLQGVSCCPQSLTCTAIFMEDPVSREMDLRSKKILYPHVSHKEHWSAPGADWNPQGCHGVF